MHLASAGILSSVLPIFPAARGGLADAHFSNPRVAGQSLYLAGEAFGSNSSPANLAPPGIAGEVFG